MLRLVRGLSLHQFSFRAGSANNKQNQNEDNTVLVLTRMTSESIILGDQLAEVKVLRVDNRTGQVRLGIEAPQTLSIHRKEIYDNICHDAYADSQQQSSSDDVRNGERNYNC